MKRPLFWAVTAFALGEVEGLYLSRILQISIVTAMLICAVIRVVKRKKLAIYMLFYVLCMVCGLVNVVARPPVDVMEYMNVTEGKAGESRVCVQGYVYNLQADKGSRNMVLRIDDGECKIQLLVYGVSENMQIGDFVRVAGILCEPAAPSNPGGFDMQSYAWSRGVDGFVYNPKCHVLDSSVAERKFTLQSLYLRWKNTIYQLRTYLTEKLYLLMNRDVADIYAGMLLGNRKNIDAELRKLYQMAGISHILAISGLHVSLLGLGVFRLLRRTGMRLSWTAGLSVLWILFYGELTGWGFATIRAVVMMVIVLGGVCLGRGADLLTGTAVALLVMLIGEPYRLLDGGMLLSFAAMFGVAFGQYVLKRLKKIKSIIRMRKKKRFCYVLFSSVIMSVSLQIVMAPVIAWIYYVIPVYSVIVNLIVIPLLTPVLLCGVFSLVIGCVNPVCGRMICMPGEYILRFYTWLCEHTVRLPGHSITVGKPEVWLIILYFILFFLLVYLTTEKPQRKMREWLYRKRHVWYDRKNWCKGVVICLCCIGGFAGAGLYKLYRYSLCEQVTFLDVGQGDGILIRTETGTNLVIDGGSATQDRLGEYVLLPALQSLAMARVDYWFVSHADTDHISGLLEILKAGELSGVQLKNLVVSANAMQDEKMRELIDLAEGQGIQICYMDMGDYVTDEESFLIRCLHPDGAFVAEDKNEASLALEYQSGKFCMLFTGDMGTEALRYMLEEEMDGTQRWYDVVKIPHHGSKYSYLEALYDMTDVVVISCGANNSYGHPHAEVLKRLEEHGTEVYRTDECGAIKVRVKRNRAEILVYGR